MSVSLLYTDKSMHGLWVIKFRKYFYFTWSELNVLYEINITEEELVDTELLRANSSFFEKLRKLTIKVFPLQAWQALGDPEG